MLSCYFIPFITGIKLFTSPPGWVRSATVRMTLLSISRSDRRWLCGSDARPWTIHRNIFPKRPDPTPLCLLEHRA